ncbi:hypothetical protein [Myxococcus sp. AB056]|uniref:hypothetical protein n=1 Tax=Myxococcus sp. AB056 TaxID=2562792 RepID=UPI001891DEB6|nr:hypothetical protein [Myxococcus sp. AB056]
MSLRLVLAASAGILVGAGGMWLALAPPAAPVVRAQIPSAGAPLTESSRAAIDVDAIRAVVREELRAASMAPPPPVGLVPAATEEPASQKEEEPSDEAATANPSPEYGEAEHVILSGLARRSWSAEDRSRLQALMSQLRPAEREALVRQLIVAANRGELKVDIEGPLF